MFPAVVVSPQSNNTPLADIPLKVTSPTDPTDPYYIIALALTMNAITTLTTAMFCFVFFCLSLLSNSGTPTIKQYTAGSTCQSSPLALALEAPAALYTCAKFRSS